MCVVVNGGFSALLSVNPRVLVSWRMKKLVLRHGILRPFGPDQLLP